MGFTIPIYQFQESKLPQKTSVMEFVLLSPEMWIRYKIFMFKKVRFVLLYVSPITVRSARLLSFH